MITRDLKIYQIEPLYLGEYLIRKLFLELIGGLCASSCLVQIPMNYRLECMGFGIILELDTRFGMEQPRAAFPRISPSPASSSSPAPTNLQISAQHGSNECRLETSLQRSCDPRSALQFVFINRRSARRP